MLPRPMHVGTLMVMLALAQCASAQDPGKAPAPEPLRPPVLDRPLFTPDHLPDLLPAPQPLLQTPVDPPQGFTGPSGIAPRDSQESSHFVPMEDRWRMGFPDWDRSGKGHPIGQDTVYQPGSIWNPYRQNVLKGDYPIIGQHTFFEFTASTFMLLEERQTPIATTPFESNLRPDRNEFFGNPNQFFYTQFFSARFDLFHGDAAFKPVDWRIVINPVFDVNSLAASELAVVSPDVTRGTSRSRSWWTLEEYFVETKIADLSPDYDFVSARVGSQPFVSDFRGFIFADINRGARLFGTRNAGRDQFNFVFFDQAEKDTNSQLNTFYRRSQEVVIANYYRQDTIWPGYTAQVSFHFDHDSPSFIYDKNDFLVRPDPVGVAQPHEVNVAYFGWAGDGHIDRYNITHAAYLAIGHDTLNPLANRPQQISAGMAAIELSYDRDWARFKTSFFWSSGDHDINNAHATGFDTILDHPNFGGGDFSYWQRQALGLFGVNLTNRQSLVPDLRSSKIQGQANFVNPGLLLGNIGVDLDLTPKLRWLNNCNWLFFEDTNVLKQYLFTGQVRNFIGTDINTGLEYRPLLNNNIIMTSGFAVLVPAGGFKDLYNLFERSVNPQMAGFTTLELRY